MGGRGPKTGDAGHIFGAGPAAFFLGSPNEEGLDPHPAAEINGSRAGRAAQRVSGRESARLRDDCEELFARTVWQNPQVRALGIAPEPLEPLQSAYPLRRRMNTPCGNGVFLVGDALRVTEPFTGQGMTGYDNVSGKYWSTWNDSMSTGVMVSEGTCDSQGKACTFTGSWTDPITKGLIKSRMTSRWTSPTTEVFEMYAPWKDGKEMKMMEITYSKK